MKVNKTDAETKVAEIDSRWETTGICLLLLVASCVGFGLFVGERNTPLGSKLALTFGAFSIIMMLVVTSCCMRPFRFRNHSKIHKQTH